MKILYLITKATRGGAQKYVYDLAMHAREEHEVVLAYGVRGRLAENLETSHVRTIRLNALARDVALISDVRSFFQILRCLREERPDVLHLNSSKAAAFGALAGRLVGIKHTIFTVHGWPFKENRNPLSRALIYFISWLTTALSHDTIVVSRLDEELGKNMWLAGKHIHYIPLGIQAPRFFSRAEADQHLKIDTSLPRLVTNAELTKNKGIRYALEAIALLKAEGIEVCYFLISDGEERQALERMVAEKGLTANVRFLGFVPEAARYLKAFDLFVLPSIKEGMPYVLLEAAAAKLPIVTTNVVDPHFLGSYENVRAVPPAEPATLANAIRDAMKESNENPLLETASDDTFKKMLAATFALYE